MAISMRKEIDDYWLHFDSPDSVANLFTIPKVPQHILGVDITAYEPTTLSIGPYHYGKEPLQAMEKEKWNCLNFILRLNCVRSIQDYLKVIARCEKRARRCYSEEINMGKKMFLQMLLLDGCFIIVFLTGIAGFERRNPGQDEQRNTSKGTRSETTGNRDYLNLEEKDESTFERTNRDYYQASCSNDVELCQISSGRDTEEKMQKHSDQETNGSSGMGSWYSCCIAHDLLLFENQIPFYIVEEIYKLLVGTETESRHLMDRMAECMESVLRHYPIAIQEADRPKEFHHLLHLCHMYFRPTQKFEEKHQGGVRERYFYRRLHFGKKYVSLDQKHEENQQMLANTQQLDSLEPDHLPGQWRRWRRAVQYHEAGVRLEKREYGQNCRHSLLDVKFSNGVIEIPCLPIDENTEALFKNFIALEQTDPRYGNAFTAYIWLMSQLVTAPDDAALLVKKGIIVHMMDSDEELSSLFTRLIKQVVIKAETNCYLVFLCRTLERHYQSRLNRWMAWLWINHLSNPWLALAVLATVIMLVCTVFQTIFTVSANVQPPE
ncbi:hypothetical protein C2845_PM15G23360 [Panicum miliaceum]|uniref:Uncharacterized protein n=1 Tax=Panicum miliaceum TaxID=4540 RepID=A0A3L6QC95_PANMI|nr:hypothetical protein C2845_PM15G23360 [Panicum miliaceum]